MGWIGGLVGGITDIAGDLINANTAKDVAAQQAQEAQQLAQQNFLDQTGYISNQEQAQRDALLNVAGQGNAYGQALDYLKAPQALPGGQFGGGSYSGAQMGAQSTPSAPNGMMAGMTAATPQTGSSGSLPAPNTPYTLVRPEAPATAQGGQVAKSTALTPTPPPTQQLGPESWTGLSAGMTAAPRTGVQTGGQRQVGGTLVQ